MGKTSRGNAARKKHDFIHEQQQTVNSNPAPRGNDDEDEEQEEVGQPAPRGTGASDDSSSSDESEDNDLVLEANPEEQGEYGGEDSEDSEVSSEEEEEQVGRGRAKGEAPASKRRKLSGDGAAKRLENDDGDASTKNQSKKRASKNDEDAAAAAGGEKGGVLNVEFVFCDMNERYFHGIKTLLASNPVHASHSSELSDLVIENISVGTVVSTEGSDDVFGVASVLNCTTNAEAPCIKTLKKLCLDNCPEPHKAEMDLVLSGKTKRPAGFLIHARMINLPLQITEVLHKQLVLDMDWAVENAEGGEDERKSLDFGAFVIMAPCTGTKGGLIYKHFDDEIFATNAEFVFTFDAPKAHATEEKQLCTVIVLTKTGHRDSMREVSKLVGG